MASFWDISTPYLCIKDSNDESIIRGGFFYDEVASSPATIKQTFPESNLWILTTLDNKDYDFLGDGSYFSSAPNFVFTSQNQVHNQMALIGMNGATFYTFGAPGDGTGNLYPSSNAGVGLFDIAGDGGSDGTGGQGGKVKRKVGNTSQPTTAYQGAYEDYDGNNNLIWTLFQKDFQVGHSLGAALAEMNYLYHDGTGTFGGSMFSTNVDGNKTISLGGLNAGDLADWTIGVNQTPVLRACTAIDESTSTIDIMTDGAYYSITGQSTVVDITFNGGNAPDGSLLRIYNDTGANVTFTHGSGMQCPFGGDYTLSAARYLELFRIGGSWIVKP